MMVGVDVTQVARIRSLLQRYPKAAERFFSDAERRHCLAHPDPAIHFAGTFAAKEAVVKALRLGSIAALVREIEIARDGDGAPSVRVNGRSRDITLSISHDAGIAIAIAVAAASNDPAVGPAGGGYRRERATSETRRASDVPKPNSNLARYLNPSTGAPTPGYASPLRDGSESFAGSDFP